MTEHIAKIMGTHLGYEDHGILTVMLQVSYGDSTGQGIGGYALDAYDKGLERRIGSAYGCEFIARTMKACGVSKWEDIKGRTIMVLKEGGEWGKVVGIGPLPTEGGFPFIFADLLEQVSS